MRSWSRTGLWILAREVQERETARLVPDPRGKREYVSAILRGGKNAFRNIIRTVSVALIIGLAIGLALTMLLSVQAVQLRIESVKSAIGSRITVSPAGSVMGVGGVALTRTQLGDVKSLPHVTRVVDTMSAQIRPGADTDLQTSVQLPASPGSQMGAVTMPVFGTGTDSIKEYKLTSGHDLKLISGATIDPTLDADKVLVGKGIADKNGLKTGSTFTVYGAKMTVAGVFDTKNMWANNVVVFPLGTLERISRRPDQVSMVYVQVDSPDNIGAIQQAISDKAGQAAAMTTTGDVLQQAVGPLQDIQRIATQNLIGSLIAGAVIIFLSMLMIVRERRREIGVVKAIGSSDASVVLQYISEAVVLALLGAAVGALIGVFMANTVFHQLMLTTGAAGQTGAPVSSSTLEIGFKAGWGTFSVVRNASNNLHATVGFGLILYGLAVALLIAIAGSAIPAWLIARVRPAEVLRGE
jgi:putative ABC transport system permease protein